MLNRFHEWLNSRLPGIQFTKEHSSHGIPFLNSFVYLSSNYKLQTKAYSKSCDEHTYIVPSSCHPAHNLRNIPYSIGHTIYRISSEEHNYQHSKAEYIEHLRARGYSIDIIQEAFSKLESKERVSYLDPKSTEESTEKRVLPFVTDFNPGLPNIGAVLNKHKHILSLDSELSKAINLDNIFASYRGAKTLEDLMIHSKLPDLPSKAPIEAETRNQEGRCQPCPKGCVVCKNYLVNTDYS